jgi:hypothetical protein
MSTTDREQIIREATYHVACYGCYDTSEAAQKDGTLCISVMDYAYLEALPEGATHRFYIMVNRTGYDVTRYTDHYDVKAHDHLEAQRFERELRGAVLDYALWYLTGEGAGYHPSQGIEARKAAIQELLNEGEEKEHDQADHPVIRDEDPTIYRVGGPGLPPPLVRRQWFVSIGTLNRCHVGLLGTNEAGQAEFVAVGDEGLKPLEFDEAE